MSSGFVSGGTTDNPVERDDEWLEAQKEIEATRQRKEESRQQDGKTLFDVLQANKVAKQEAFEESIRLKNQFRSLDEDEIDFLDSVLESTRAKEAAVKKETTEQLDLFRKQQEEADKALLLSDPNIEHASVGAASGGPITEDEQWIINGRKRKKGKEKEGLKGVKLRKSSSTNERPVIPAASSPSTSQIKDQGKQFDQTLSRGNVSQLRRPNEDEADTSTKPTTAFSSKATPPMKPSAELSTLGLGNYSSEDDD
ncbi:MAG: hypothetical protein M1835_007377 [Candelina submexicana]|nr:MAG: hypothetical protein M1835_007377 [Candelina submexicana]